MWRSLVMSCSHLSFVLHTDNKRGWSKRLMSRSLVMSWSKAWRHLPSLPPLYNYLYCTYTTYTTYTLLHNGKVIKYKYKYHTTFSAFSADFTMAAFTFQSSRLKPNSNGHWEQIFHNATSKDQRIQGAKEPRIQGVFAYNFVLFQLPTIAWFSTLLYSTIL